MIILTGHGEDYAYFVPDIGDTIYDLVWHLDHYECDKRIVNKISIDGADIIIWFKSLCVGRSLKAINKLWFMTEKEAINACNKYKKELQIKGKCKI